MTAKTRCSGRHLLTSALAAFAILVGNGLAGAQEVMETFVWSDKPEPVPDFAFTDGEGNALTLADFKGKVVLLNIWATWCVPCREEMPTLDRLQAELGGDRFEVVALSIDRDGIEDVGPFFAEIGIEHLRVYLDQPNAASRALDVLGIPTTVFISDDGRDLGRLVGPAEWDSPEALALIRPFVEKPKDAGCGCPMGKSGSAVPPP